MSHYDNQYFDWQKDLGRFGGRINLFMFEKYISPSDNVLDFGCGGGYLLANISCQSKLGIEINDAARQNALENDITAVKSTGEVPNDWADVVISHHALEHTLCPYDELRKLYPKIKNGGRLVFVVPHELKGKYRSEDINKHLYTWTPLNLGNLFSAAGYTVREVHTIKHRWPPYYNYLYKYLGETIFHLLSAIYARIQSRFLQVRIIAYKV